ncbi:MAG: hypothetical protein COW19_08720 [Zetaproteobacteria bacterium CG12_big_fil_rev_8_21_14_0_65_55_1124]|nr:MAG: hypothetical protein COT53_02560 [Zetaproteobacteria bacterium CG08_land_8_20_14_0_20_55_17]PIW42337.1 MAG: hypothetical protein COW19_08720 [Zetaproteobacteria bacterium CG12_big_fil_rev_8_21_14_0_65_55_1124]PIY53435.1 MAG: hypothetical protein COZ01_03850 [Zetaproteobacteria bacterium CG_4_10_14_0_8_um_filter_55_43]PIZ38596.1 MAG: hypothetical protein COY36_05860 [Zetaproteobacteria bacterium CG_4_10_14_0_2_um_filter_55_20]PJB79282.1 MAG: hypothetical protein CO089_10730 [Zetaproteoba
MLSKIQEAFQPRYLGLIGLCLLAWAYLSMFSYDNYGIEESAALDILLNWSIVHQIASPVAFFGVPDLRAVMFIPLDMYWAGSLIAVKVFSMYILFGAALIMYRWSEEVHGSESSMMATALLLLAPISLMQTNAIGSGIYLLFCFVVIGWLNQMVRDSEKALPSWFFLQLMMAALAISMHPMGLAVPLALGIHWWRNAGDAGKTRRMIASVSFVTIFMLFVRWGWYGMDDAAANPLSILGDSLLGSPLLHDTGIGFGILIAAMLFITIGMHLYRRINDPVSIMLLSASLIGLLHADHAWVFIAWVTTLYLGLPLLIELNERLGGRNLMGQRGILLLLVVCTATISMLNTRQLELVAKQHLKGPVDMLISVLEKEAADTNAPFIAASQWPARTLLACRRDVLPLPPASDDLATFQKQTTGLTHITFNPQLEKMHALARNAASLSTTFETIALMPDGVVLKAKKLATETPLPDSKH